LTIGDLPPDSFLNTACNFTSEEIIFLKDFVENCTPPSGSPSGDPSENPSGSSSELPQSIIDKFLSIGAPQVFIDELISCVFTLDDVGTTIPPTSVLIDQFGFTQEEVDIFFEFLENCGSSEEPIDIIIRKLQECDSVSSEITEPIITSLQSCSRLFLPPIRSIEYDQLLSCITEDDYLFITSWYNENCTGEDRISSKKNRQISNKDCTEKIDIKQIAKKLSKHGSPNDYIKSLLLGRLTINDLPPNDYLISKCKFTNCEIKALHKYVKSKYFSSKTYKNRN
jgi:hypothetical protein